MDPTASRGNDAQRWEKLLTELDEKLQLGLLERLRRIASYHFEAELLFIEPGTADDAQYLKRDAVFQQLGFLAQEAVGVETVRLGKP